MISEMHDYIKVLEAMGMDLPGQQGAGEAVVASGITVNDGPVAFSYVPMVVTEEDKRIFQGVIDGISPILEKMTRHYVESADYRKIFGFSKEMEELICLPCDYSCVIPFGRYDLFYDFESGAYSFCEINTDGSGGMSWNDKVTEAVLGQFGNQEYLKEEGIRMYNATDLFAGGIVECFQSSSMGKQLYADGVKPLIAIVDFKEEGVTTDFDGILEALDRLGVQARFTDIRNLVVETAEDTGGKGAGAVLKDVTDGAVIHGIYRRAVTSVVLERYEECTQLIEAVRQSKVVLMGHFRTSLAHSKTVFATMHHPETMAILTEEEQTYVRKHVPATYILRDGLLSEEELEEVARNKDAWVLKPEEGFGSYGVCCGLDVTEAEWKQFLDEALNKPYILQAFCKRYTIPVVRGGSEQVEDYPLMLGIFQTNGKVAGCYNRAGKAGVIDYSHGCVCVGTAEKL